MAGWRATQDYLQSNTLRPNGKLVRTNPSSKRTLESRIHWFDNVLERAPEQMWPAVAHPRILDALGAIVAINGPTPLLPSLLENLQERPVHDAQIWMMHGSNNAELPSGASQVRVARECASAKTDCSAAASRRLSSTR